MLLSFACWAARRLLRLLTAVGDRDDAARDVEILVLRHQLRVLSRGRHLSLRRRNRILCWRRREGCCRASAGGHFRSRRRPYCAGTANW
jgi:hypothetical protein